MKRGLWGMCLRRQLGAGAGHDIHSEAKFGGQPRKGPGHIRAYEQSGKNGRVFLFTVDSVTDKRGKDRFVRAEAVTGTSMSAKWAAAIGLSAGHEFAQYGPGVVTAGRAERHRQVCSELRVGTNIASAGAQTAHRQAFCGTQIRQPADAAGACGDG